MVKKGSLVKTDKGDFFVSITLGKIQVEGSLVIAISPESPLGSKLIGLTTSEIANINGTIYAIQGIY
jgi:hypothetical protein